MIRVDLHCHSRFSAHPSEWFLKRIGTRESYTDIEDLYAQAKRRGMTHVTVTDHNTIDGARQLVESHPEDTFISVETTAYFPEDGCKVHILIYDIDPEQFDAIQEHRQNIYELRDYLRKCNIACSVAHATYSVNGRLKQEHIEKLLLLFNVFEGINGARGALHNETLQQVLSSMTPAYIKTMEKKYCIEPWGDEPWIKGRTAGSDDHAGLFIGRTFTTDSKGSTVHSLINSIRNREASIEGSQGDHKSLAFAIYKIARDFSKDKMNSGPDSILSFVSHLLFDDQRSGVRDWWTLSRMKMAKDSRSKAMARFCAEIAAYESDEPHNTHARIDAIYSSLGRLTDEFFVMIMTSLEKDLKSGHADKVLKNLSAAIPAVFMIAPFISSMHHLYSRNREVLRSIKSSLAKGRKKPSRLLWFSDTVTDLNGVAVTMRELAETAARTGHPVKLVTSIPKDEGAALPRNTINLPCIYSVTPDFYSAYTLRLPSVLNTLDIIASEAPDEIVISTPGPVGLLGLAAARILGIKCTGVYHTDFTKQADHFIGDAWVSSTIESFTRWFFQQMDHIRVPSRQYITIMSSRGLDPNKMSVFRRGIEPSFAEPQPDRQQELKEKFKIPESPCTLMWAGRLGKEKNLDFLMEVVEEVTAKHPDASLLMAGDGPELERLSKAYAHNKRIVFTGRVSRIDLSQLYLMSDLFVFPSTTDTFGMVILEGHACGLPAIVTDIGGPQEIVRNAETGFVVKANDKKAWIGAVSGMLDMIKYDNNLYADMCSKARECSNGDYGWERVLDEMTGSRTSRSAIKNAGEKLEISAPAHT